MKQDQETRIGLSVNSNSD